MGTGLLLSEGAPSSLAAPPTRMLAALRATGLALGPQVTPVTARMPSPAPSFGHVVPTPTFPLQAAGVRVTPRGEPDIHGGQRACLLRSDKLLGKRGSGSASRDWRQEVRDSCRTSAAQTLTSSGTGGPWLGPPRRRGPGAGCSFQLSLSFVRRWQHAPHGHGSDRHYINSQLHLFNK